MLALEYGELLAEGNEFEAEVVPRTEEGAEIRKEKQEVGHEVGVFDKR